MQYKSFQKFLSQKAGASGKAKKEKTCSACNAMQVVAFCKHVLIWQSKDSNPLTLKVS